MIDVMLISFFILFLLTLFPSFPLISSFDNLFFLAIKEDGSVLISAYVSIKGNLCSNSTDLVWGFNRHLYGMIYTPARNRKAQSSILKRFSVFAPLSIQIYHKRFTCYLLTLDCSMISCREIGTTLIFLMSYFSNETCRSNYLMFVHPSPLREIKGISTFCPEL